MTEKAPKYLSIPQSAWQDIRSLIKLPPDRLKAISALLRSKETLRSQLSLSQQIAAEVGLPRPITSRMVTAIRNLLRQRRERQVSDDQLVEDLESGLPQEFASLSPEARDALLDLLSASEDKYIVEKAQKLSTSLIPHLLGTTSVCEIRPILDSSRTRVEGALVITLLGLEVHDADHETRTIVVQLTNDLLRDLRRALDDAEKKAAVIEEHFKRNTDLF